MSVLDVFSMIYVCLSEFYGYFDVMWGVSGMFWMYNTCFVCFWVSFVGTFACCAVF